MCDCVEYSGSKGQGHTSSICKQVRSELAGIERQYMAVCVCVCVCASMLQSWYTFLQALVMLMLVIRLISLTVVQPRLRVISRTLGHVLPDLVHIVVGPLLVTVVMLGAALCIVFYNYEVGHSVPLITVRQT